MDKRIKQVLISIELPGDPNTFSKSIAGQQANYVTEVLEDVKMQICDMLDIESTKLHGSDASFKIAHHKHCHVRISRKIDRADEKKS